MLFEPSAFVNNLLSSYARLALLALGGLIVFLVLMERVNPPGKIPDLSDRQGVIHQSRDFLAAADHETSHLKPFAIYRSNDELIHQQIDHFGRSELNRFIRNGFLHYVPSWYWEVLWIDTEEKEELYFTTDSHRSHYGQTIYLTRHAPAGSVQHFSIESPENRFGETYSTPPEDLSQWHDKKPAPETGSALMKTPLMKPLVRGTVWDTPLVTISEISRSEFHGRPVTRIKAGPETDLFGHVAEVTFSVGDDGMLLAMQHTVTVPDLETRDETFQLSMIRFVFFTVALLFILILFLRRLFLRLIDFRSATTFAIITFVLSLLHFVHLIFQVSLFDQIDQLHQIIVIFITFSLLALVIAGLAFVIASLAESLSRELWPEKIITLTLLRLGYLRSSAVGHSLITGVLTSLVLLGIAATGYALIDHSIRNPLENKLFFSESYYFSPWHIFATSLFWTVLISAGLFGCIISRVGLATSNRWIPLAIGTLALPLMISAGLETSSPAGLVFIIGLLGFSMTWLFQKYDHLALLVTVFFFLVAWTTADSLFLSGSPDRFLSWGVYGLMMIMLGFGGYLSLNGNDYEHLPELTPDYIREIAREQRVERELEIARQVHQSFLPVKLPDIDRVDVAASCKAAFDVGGDYYDVIPVDENHVAFVIGDVSGKGIQAAFYMTMIKGMFRSLVKEIPTPLPLLSRINQLFYENARRGSFISVCYGLLDTRSGLLKYARAGHNPAILIRSEENKPELIRSGGMALGLTKGAEFESTLTEKTIQLHHGDTVLFYTDGLTEATDVRNNMYGDERLLAEISISPHKTATELLDGLHNNVFSFLGQESISDDLTLLVARYLPDNKKGNRS